MLVIYMIFSLGLYLWTCRSMSYEIAVPRTEYLLGVILLAVFLLMVRFMVRKKSVFCGVCIMAVFMNLGLSIAYRAYSFPNVAVLEVLKQDSYTRDLILMLSAFMLVFLVIRCTELYKIRIFNLMLLAGLPIIVFGARVLGKPVNGSYLYFAGVMIFGLVLMGFPFVAAYFLAQPEDRYRAGKVGNLSWNLMGLLLYTFILYFGCAVCNEFGLLLMLGATTTVLFFVRCKNLLTKVFYVLGCVLGAVLAATKADHIWARVQIWLDPAAAFEKSDIAVQAESVLYLFRHFNSIGWWGNGIGNLSKGYYPTLNTDHVLITLTYDYSILLAMLVIVLAVVLVGWMLKMPAGLPAYERYLIIGCGLIMAFMVLINVGSTLGSFITAGIGFPWISDGSGINIMLTTLAAIRCGVDGKKVAYD